MRFEEAVWRHIVAKEKEDRPKTLLPTVVPFSERAQVTGSVPGSTGSGPPSSPTGCRSCPVSEGLDARNLSGRWLTLHVVHPRL